MKIEMSYLLLVLATVLAPVVQGQSTPPQPKITGVLTILSPKPGVTVEQVMKSCPPKFVRPFPCISTARFSSGSRAATAGASSSY
jgi:hypothetical protein